MDSNEVCESHAEAVQLVQNLSDSTEPLNLSNINDDCKELIFERLDWPHLLNLADTNKQLYTAVCRVFKRKYGNAKICLGFPIHWY